MASSFLCTVALASCVLAIVLAAPAAVQDPVHAASVSLTDSSAGTSLLAGLLRDKRALYGSDAKVTADKCVKEEAKILGEESNRAATDAEIRILLNQKKMPNEIVAMIIAERNKLRKSDPRIKNPPQFIAKRLRMAPSCGLVFSSKN